MKKFIRILLCTVLLSGTMLLSQGCGARGEHEAAPDGTQETASRQGKLDSDTSNGGAEDSDTTNDENSDAASTNHVADDTVDASVGHTSGGTSAEEAKSPGLDRKSVV